MQSSDTPSVWLLVIAHPEDESLFFAPTLRSLIKARSGESRPQVRILCLSNSEDGNFDGKERTEQLYDAADKLGLLDDGVIVGVKEEDGDSGDEAEDVDEKPKAKGIKFADDMVKDDGGGGGGVSFAGGEPAAAKPKRRIRTNTIIGTDGPKRVPRISANLSSDPGADLNSEKKRRERTVVRVMDNPKLQGGKWEEWDKMDVATVVFEHICRIVPAIIEGGQQTSSLIKDKGTKGWWVLNPDKPTHGNKDDLKDVQLNIVTFAGSWEKEYPNQGDISEGVKALLREHLQKEEEEEETETETETEAEACIELVRRKSGVSFSDSGLIGDGHEDTLRLSFRAYGLRSVKPPLIGRTYLLFDLISWFFRTVLFLSVFIKPTDKPHAPIKFRIFEPARVLKAVATHSKHQGLKNGLGRLFDRYTYVNELCELNPQTGEFVSSSPPGSVAKLIAYSLHLGLLLVLVLAANELTRE